MFDIELPENMSLRLIQRINKFRSKCLKWRLPMEESKEAKKEDFYWAISEAKTLLRLIDKNMLKIKTTKGDWE